MKIVGSVSFIYLVGSVLKFFVSNNFISYVLGPYATYCFLNILIYVRTYYYFAESKLMRTTTNRALLQYHQTFWALLTTVAAFIFPYIFHQFSKSVMFICMVPDLLWFGLHFFDFVVVWKWFPYLNSEFAFHLSWASCVLCAGLSQCRAAIWSQGKRTVTLQCRALLSRDV